MKYKLGPTDARGFRISDNLLRIEHTDVAKLLNFVSIFTFALVLKQFLN